MRGKIPIFQPLFCIVGLHHVPPPRDPPGPVVATCSCCRKTMYCYGMHLYNIGVHPVLMLPSFPRIQGNVVTGRFQS